MKLEYPVYRDKVMGCWAGKNVGGVLGALNGLFIGYFELPAMIVTLGTSNVFKGIMQGTLNSKQLAVIPAGMKSFGTSALFIAENKSSGLTSRMPTTTVPVRNPTNSMRISIRMITPILERSSSVTATSVGRIPTFPGICSGLTERSPSGNTMIRDCLRPTGLRTIPCDRYPPVPGSMRTSMP